MSVGTGVPVVALSSDQVAALTTAQVAALSNAQVAAIATAVIAVRGADPVLNKEDFERDLKAATANLQGQAKTDALITLQPANQARNHAASPVVPKAP